MHPRAATVPTVHKRRPATTATAAAPSLYLYNRDNASTGAWYTMHLLAACDERDALETVVRVFGRRFACARCRGHLRAFVNKSPIPSPPYRTGRELFDWTVAFHNEVNERIPGAKQMAPKKADELLMQLTVWADRDGEAVAAEEAAGGGAVAPCNGCDGGGAPLSKLHTKLHTKSAPASPPVLVVSTTSTAHRRPDAAIVRRGG